MKKLFLKSFKILLPLVLGAFIFYWVYKDFDFSQLAIVYHQDFQIGRASCRERV